MSPAQPLTAYQPQLITPPAATYIICTIGGTLESNRLLPHYISFPRIRHALSLICHLPFYSFSWYMRESPQTFGGVNILKNGSWCPKGLLISACKICNQPFQYWALFWRCSWYSCDWSTPRIIFRTPCLCCASSSMSSPQSQRINNTHSCWGTIHHCPEPCMATNTMQSR